MRQEAKQTIQLAFPIVIGELAKLAATNAWFKETHDLEIERETSFKSVVVG